MIRTRLMLCLRISVHFIVLDAPIIWCSCKMPVLVNGVIKKQKSSNYCKNRIDLFRACNCKRWCLQWVEEMTFFLHQLFQNYFVKFSAEKGTFLYSMSSYYSIQFGQFVCYSLYLESRRHYYFFQLFRSILSISFVSAF